MEDEHYRHAAYALMLHEQAPTLKVQGVDLQDYANRLIERYSNPALRHRTADCDGWQPEIATADVGFCSLASGA